MPICTEKWRADISQFHSLTRPVRVITLLRHGFSKMQIIFWFFFNLFCCLFLRQHGSIEVNPGLKKKATVEHFSCCHGNLNRLAAHDYKKVSLLEVYNDKKNGLCSCSLPLAILRWLPKIFVKLWSSNNWHESE